MGDSWIPYFFIAIIALLIFSCFYVYKHKEEVFELAGIELPGMKERPHKKQPRVRPNAKKTNKMYGNKNQRQNDVVNRKDGSSQQSIVAQTNNNKALKNQKNPKKSEDPKTSGDPEDDGRISDVPIDTKGSALNAFQLNNTGSLLICSSKNHEIFLFAIGGLDFMPYPLQQCFELEKGDIISLCTLQLENSFQIVYAHANSLSFKSSVISFDEEAKPIITQGAFRINNAFTRTVQKMASSPNAKYVMTLVDHQILTIYNPNNEVLFTNKFDKKKCGDMAVMHNFSGCAVSCDNTLYYYRICETPLVKLELEAKTTVKSPIISVSISEKSRQIITASSDGLITIFKNPIDSGVAFRFTCTNVKLVRASPTTDFLAILSQKAKLQIVNSSTGELNYQLETVHEGDAHFIEWSLNGNWLFIASKEKPIIQSFCVKTSEEK